MVSGGQVQRSGSNLPALPDGDWRKLPFKSTRRCSLKLITVLTKTIMGIDAPDMGSSFPSVEAWMNRMACRATVQRVIADRAAVLATQ